MKAPKKITSKTMGADKESILELVMKDKKSEIPLYNVVGGAFKATVEDSDNGMGEYIKLHGSFIGISLLTGEEVTSGVCILPDVAASLIAGNIMAKESDNGKAYAELSLTITAQYSKESATSYVFGVDIHNTDVDVYTKLKAMIPKKLMPKTN